METNLFLLVLSCTVLLFLGLSHVHADNDLKPSAMEFLKPLTGTRKGNIVKGLSQLKRYLSNLGYMDFNNTTTEPVHANDDSFDDNLEKAVRDYQTFFKLKVTGMLDPATVALMSRPRCGVPDFKKTLLDYHSLYTFFPGTPKWQPGKRNLTYSFPPGTRPDAYKAISDAASLWASVSLFRFKYIPEYDKADIKISFQYRNHGDGNSFDGSGGILAHAFAPSDGRLHFDGDERWVNGVVGGSFDIQTVGLHELGHVLGLGHSADGGSIMWPSIGNGFRKLLGKDDIDGIKALYPS